MALLRAGGMSARVEVARRAARAFSVIRNQTRGSKMLAQQRAASELILKNEARVMCRERRAYEVMLVYDGDVSVDNARLIAGRGAVVAVIPDGDAFAHAPAPRGVQNIAGGARPGCQAPRAGRTAFARLSRARCFARATRP